MIEMYNALKFITMLFLFQKVLRFNVGVAFLKSVNIADIPPDSRSPSDYQHIKTGCPSR